MLDMMVTYGYLSTEGVSKAFKKVDRVFFFSSRRRHTRFDCDWSSDVCSSDLLDPGRMDRLEEEADKNAGKEGAVRKASSRAVGVSKPARTKVKNEDGLAEAMDG